LVAGQLYIENKSARLTPVPAALNRVGTVGSATLPHCEAAGVKSQRTLASSLRLSFRGPSASRENDSVQVSRISENARFFHCLGSLGAMRHRSGLF
jgi:hypothetical protein